MAAKTDKTEKAKKKTYVSGNVRYIEAVGRRKRAVARVRIVEDKTKRVFIINEKDVNTYFPTD